MSCFGGRARSCSRGVVVGTNFSFIVSASGAPFQKYTVPAGPKESGGYCIADGTFALGTKMTVTELPAAGYTLASISVNGKGVPAGTPSANLAIGNGVNEVAFTNAAGNTPPTSASDSSPLLLTVVNYELASREKIGTEWRTTYRADLLNTGTMLDAATATVASLDLSRVQVVAGAEVLRFAPVPANSQITSRNTVTIVSGDDAPIDFSKLKWTVDMTRASRRRGANH